MKSRGRLYKLAQVSENVLTPTPSPSTFNSPEGGTPLNGLYGEAKPESRPAPKGYVFSGFSYMKIREFTHSGL